MCEYVEEITRVIDELRFWNKDRVVTNFNLSDEYLHLQAIQKYGKTTIYISDYAEDIYGHELSDCKSLHDSSFQDLTEFWKIFDSYKKK